MTDRPLDALGLREPEGQPVGADPAPAGDPEVQLHLPPLELGAKLGPDGPLLATEGRGDADALLAGDGVWKSRTEGSELETFFIGETSRDDDDFISIPCKAVFRGKFSLIFPSQWDRCVFLGVAKKGFEVHIKRSIITRSYAVFKTSEMIMLQYFSHLKAGGILLFRYSLPKYSKKGTVPSFWAR